MSMLNNCIRTSIRSVRKDMKFSIINIFELSVGLAFLYFFINLKIVR